MSPLKQFWSVVLVVLLATISVHSSGLFHEINSSHDWRWALFNCIFLAFGLVLLPVACRLLEEEEGGLVTRYFFDTEFNEDGSTIELISIGIVSDDGREYYAVSDAFDPALCNDFVHANVLPKLPPKSDPAWKPRSQIRDEIFAFVEAGSPHRPEFWAYYADYDWVVFCQLWGRMIDLPADFPKYCNDLKQVMVSRGILTRDLPKQPEGSEHNALDDARWNKASYDWIERFSRGRP